MVSDYALAEHLRKELESEKHRLSQAIVNGVRSWDDYKYQLGRLHGLALAATALDELTIAMEKENDRN